MKKTILIAGLVISLFSNNGAMAQESVTWDYTADKSAKEILQLDKDISYLQRKWAKIKYEGDDLVYQDEDNDAQEDAMEDLAKEAASITAKHPNKAKPIIWEAIIVSTQGGLKGGLGALSLVKRSKKLLEQALEINPTALSGSAYTSLGSLYYQVPGWPIGFGSDKKAKKYLLKALEINPDGIDSNYFYGDFLYEEGEYREAKKVLEHALNAPSRPNRPIADKGRQQEIQHLIRKIMKKI